MRIAVYRMVKHRGRLLIHGDITQGAGQVVLSAESSDPALKTIRVISGLDCRKEKYLVNLI
jgi:hypothetical protein